MQNRSRSIKSRLSLFVLALGALALLSQCAAPSPYFSHGRVSNHYVPKEVSQGNPTPYQGDLGY